MSAKSEFRNRRVEQVENVRALQVADVVGKYCPAIACGLGHSTREVRGCLDPAAPETGGG